MPSFSLLPLVASLASLLLLSACQSLPASSAQQSSDSQTTSQANQSTQRHEYQLDNGLKVVIKEDHRAPVVMTQLWYDVGSADEPEDKGGISHLLEHMMFKGTKDVSATDFERLIAKFGGTNNAFTSYDYTGYFELFPANYAPLALELEADRMKNLTFDADQYAKEHQVVMEERRQRTDDNPLAKAYEAFRKQALPDSPKGESVIGPMTELESIELSEVKGWYAQWYYPDNATLVIVGDVQPDAIMTHVRRYFGNIKNPSSRPARPSVRQSSHQGYQQSEFATAVNVPTLLMAYNVPSLVTAEDSNSAYAISLLQDVLDGGLSARLESRLVREQDLLASVSTSYSVFDRGDTLFLVQATPRDGVSLEQAQAAITEQIEQLKTAPIAEEELQRAKTSTVTGLVYAQDSMSGQARMIGLMQSIGLDDRLLDTLPEQLDNISIDAMRQAAKHYFVKDNLTVMYVIPEQTAGNEMTSEMTDETANDNAIAKTDATQAVETTP